MKSIKDLELEIKRLEQLKREMETQLSLAIRSAISTVVNRYNGKRKQATGRTGTIIKFSELIPSTWNPAFYNWDEMGEMVYKFLESKEHSRWTEILKERLDNSKDKRVVNIEIPGNSRKSEKVCYEFIEQLIEEINQ